MNSLCNIEFLSAKIHNQQPLLHNNNLKLEIIESLHWLERHDCCKIYGFSIMPTHLNLVWKIFEKIKRINCQGALFRFTGHMFKKFLEKNDPKTLNKYFVEKRDRKYHFWHGNPLVEECPNIKVLQHKLNIIHNQPCYPKWNLAKCPEEYYWSSAAFYKLNDRTYPWLTHYDEIQIVTF